MLSASPAPGQHAPFGPAVCQVWMCTSGMFQRHLSELVRRLSHASFSFKAPISKVGCRCIYISGRGRDRASSRAFTAGLYPASCFFYGQVLRVVRRLTCGGGVPLAGISPMKRQLGTQAGGSEINRGHRPLNINRTSWHTQHNKSSWRFATARITGGCLASSSCRLCSDGFLSHFRHFGMMDRVRRARTGLRR